MEVMGGDPGFQHRTMSPDRCKVLGKMEKLAEIDCGRILAEKMTGTDLQGDTLSTQAIPRVPRMITDPFLNFLTGGKPRM